MGGGVLYFTMTTVRGPNRYSLQNWMERCFLFAMASDKNSDHQTDSLQITVRSGGKIIKSV